MEVKASWRKGGVCRADVGRRGREVAFSAAGGNARMQAGPAYALWGDDKVQEGVRLCLRARYELRFEPLAPFACLGGGALPLWYRCMLRVHAVYGPLTHINVMAVRVPYPVVQQDSGGSEMIRVVLMLYGIVATSLAGAGVIGVLAMGVAQVMPIVAAAATGAILALPVSYFVASRMVS